MSVTVELIGACRWRVTAQPDSGKAFWTVEVQEDHRLKNPMYRVLVALRKARRIDKQFSIAEIERREARRNKRRQQLHDLIHGMTEEKETTP